VVYIGDGTTSMPAEEFDVARMMFTEAGVELLHLPPATSEG
jgi:dCMP deaminase